MRMLFRFVAALLVLTGAVLSALPARAQGGSERILNFVSDIAVQRNGDLIVSETIKVWATGNTIKRGILRDFPTSYTTRNGTHIEVGFEVTSVTRAGAAETFATERLSNGTRVRIGSADRTLSRGEHEYVITYRTTRQVGFFKDYDELYWNVTGNGWTFPIDRAEARITLPDAVTFRQSAFYTGPQGVNEKNAEIVEQKPGRIVFRTTRALDAHSGLTVAAGWDKGVVIPPTQAERWATFARDNMPVALTLAALIALLGYLAYAYRVVGRDPPTGTMVPLFSPPEGMTAAAVRYVNRMGMDEKTFTAAIVDIAVRGHARLVEKKKDGMRLEPRDGKSPLPPPETDMERKLFGAKRNSPVDLSRTSHSVLERARKALEDGLSKTYGDRLFQENKGWSARATYIAIAFCAVVLVSAFVAWGENIGWSIVWGTAFLLPAAAVLSVVTVNGGLHSSGQWLAFAICGGIAFVIAAFGTIGFLPGFVHAIPAAAPLVLLPLAYSAYFWMPAYSPEGRRLTDQIDGFRHYLSVAERTRLDALNPPQETAALFEKYLPYAIALDVENQWGQRFAGVLAAAAAAGAAHHIATSDGGGWYSGQRDWSDWSSNPSGFASHVGDGLTNTISAASVPPATTTSSGSSFSSDSSSSYSGGSSDSGSSGGGGGGGGGSGW